MYATMLAGLARALTCGDAEGEVGNREGLSHHGQLRGEVVATLDSREAGLVIRFDLGTAIEQESGARPRVRHFAACGLRATA